MTERDPNQPIDDAPTVAWTLPPAGQVVEVMPPSVTRVEPQRGGNRLRWGIAVVVTVLVVGVAAAAFALLAGQTAPSKLLGFVPSDSVVYGEVRLDLPGDQRQKLGQFLSKFPGFADQSTLDAKLDEAFDRLVRGATHDSQDYTTKIKPWFGGEIGFSVGKLPVPAASSDVHGLLIISVTDAARARAWFDDVSSAAPRTTDTYNGVDLVLIGEGQKKAAFGIDGNVMLAGDEASVRAAIDSKGNGTFAANERFKQGQASVSGDALGYVFLDGSAYLDWVSSVGPSMPGLGVAVDDATRRLIPAWFVMRLQARGDAIALEAVAPSIPTTVQRQNRVSKLAPHVPATTIAILDAHDYGAALLEMLDRYRNSASTREAFKQIDQAASLLGGFDAILGWMEDAGVVITRDGSSVNGGLVFTSKDRAAGERLLSTLRSFAVLGGGQSGVTVRDEKHGDTTISIVDLGDLRDLGTKMGLSTLPIEGHGEIAYASTADLIVVGVGDTFVKSVLDAGPGTSLADDGRFKSLIGRVGEGSTGDVYVDITAVRELVESVASTQSGFAEYEKSFKPYVVPLDAWIEATIIDGDLDRSTGLVVVK
jgi:hypothetical protein